MKKCKDPTTRKSSHPKCSSQREMSLCQSTLTSTHPFTIVLTADKAPLRVEPDSRDKLKGARVGVRMTVLSNSLQITTKI